MNKKIKCLLIILPIILLILIIIFISVDSVTRFENWVYFETVERMSPLLTNIMKVITHTGDAICVISICLVMFAIPQLRKNYAIPISITIIISAILNIILKNLFSRERPDILRLINETGYSFPSGHSMNNIALYTIIVLLTIKNVENKAIKYSIIIYSTIMTFLIGISRVYLGVHYITDVIGGWIIGFTIAVSIYLIWNKIMSYINKYYI